MLEGRKILVTGGASGIGAATAKLARERGAEVQILDRQAPEGGADENFLQADVSDFEQVEAAIALAASRMGGLDGIANVAGIGRGASKLEDTKMEDWNNIFAVNLTGPLNVMRAALPHLQKAEQASVVNVSSCQGIRPFAGVGAYGASKRALLSLTQTWAQELGPNIRVNAICPGFIATPMLGDPTRRPTEALPLKRVGKPEEVAKVIAFLLGQDSSYVTGAILPVDGGRSI